MWNNFECKIKGRKYTIIRPGKWVIWVGYGSGLNSARVNFGLAMFRPGSGSVWVEFGSGMFRVVYGNPVQIGYGSSLIGFGSMFG